MAKNNDKLTQIQPTGSTERTALTKYERPKFTLCFREPLDNGYTFKELRQNHLKDIHNFLKKVAGETVTNVDRLYLRDTDENDKRTIDDSEKQIVHYQVTRSFRIHGYYDDGLFIACRLDPNHQYHNK